MVRRNTKGKNNPNWNGGKEKRICPFCKSIFYEWKSQKMVTCGKKECHNKQLSKVKKGIVNQNNINPMWKGKKVQYGALHGWIRRHKPKPMLCEKCKKTSPIDLANISNK